MLRKINSAILAMFAACALALGFASTAFAQATAQPAVDVADVVTGIGNQVAPIGLVAVAVMGIFVALKAYKWVRRALS